MIFERLKRVSAAVGKLEFVVAVAALSISTLMSFSGVVFRYVLEMEAWWVFPIQQYTYITLVFFGAAIAARKGIHVRVEVFDTLLAKKPKSKYGLRTAMRAISVVAAIMFTYLAFGFMIRMWQTPQHDVVLQWFNLGWVKSLPFVLGLLFFAYFSAALVNSIHEYKSMTKEEGEQL